MEKMICVNLKTYLNSKEEVNKYIDSVKDIKDNLIVFPPIIYLDKFIRNGFKVGIQDISIYDEGAHTGSITAKSVKDFGIDYVLIGHSEINDSDDIINIKIKKSLENNLKVILCVHNKREIKENVIIAYEPIEAISSGIMASISDITDTLNYYKNKDVLYGGSISSENINTLNQIDNLKGYLIGKSGVSSIDLKKIEEVINN